MSKVNYEKLGSMIMQYGLEDGIGMFIEGEDSFVEFVDNLEQDLFASTELLEMLIKHLLSKYLECYDAHHHVDRIFNEIINCVEE